MWINFLNFLWIPTYSNQLWPCWKRQQPQRLNTSGCCLDRDPQSVVEMQWCCRISWWAIQSKVLFYIIYIYIYIIYKSYHLYIYIYYIYTYKQNFCWLCSPCLLLRFHRSIGFCCLHLYYHQFCCSESHGAPPETQNWTSQSAIFHVAGQNVNTPCVQTKIALKC